MTTVTGTFDITSLLANRFQSVAEYGLDTIERVLQADIAAHNAIVTEMVSEMCEITTDRQRIYGSSAGGEMIEVDEYGRAPTQKAVTGGTCAFPLKLFQWPVGWTEKWMQTKTPADMATMVLAAEKAHWRQVQRQIKMAIYNSTNLTFLDHLVDNVSLTVRRFLNADSTAIPDGPNGEVFVPASHTHYEGEASLTAAFATECIRDLVEHGHGGSVKMAISTTDEAAFRLLTGFVAYVDPRLLVPSAVMTSGTPAVRLDISRLDNRAIGIFGAAEVWVKPWAIANYLFAWDAEGNQKPLCLRQRAATSLQGLRIASTLNSYPLFAQFLEAEFGVGVWTRTNGSVLYFANATYSDPVIS